jgi:putative cell wall-binding protein
MYSGYVWTTGDVQAFLQQQVPRCQAGYTCLKDYTVTTPSMPGDAVCMPYQGGQNESAAQIIAKVGQACGISQKVLLVLLQKESELVNDDFPGQKQYDQAMGFDCSDSAPCNPEYAGFFKQVYWAAWSLDSYRVQPAAGEFPVGTPVSVLYSPNPSCDPASSKLTLRNQATASLYDYTPYQPNQAALDGGGDACSSYGNLNFWIIYTDWFGYPQVDVDRISGDDRYAVAVAISQAAFPGTAPVVYIATGANYPDALSAGPAAVKQGGPLLLTAPDALPSAVIAEIQRLKVSKVVIVGGPNSVSAAVAAQLRAVRPGVTLPVDRISGADRYEVSRNVAQYAFGGGASRAYIATGANFPDALSASGAGGHLNAPVVLVNGGATSVDQPTRDLLTTTLKVSAITIAGGPNSVSTSIESVLNGIAGTSRLSGADRYEASMNINFNAYGNTDRVFLATGSNFPDALAGSAWAGKAAAPLFVVPTNCVPKGILTQLRPRDVTKVTLLGGPNSLGSGVMNLTSCG